MNDDDLVSKYQDRVWGLPCAQGDAIGESLEEPYRTVCILSLAHCAIENSGLLNVFAVALDSTPFTAITDAYVRIGCKREADIITSAVDMLGFADKNFDDRGSYIEAHRVDVIAKLEPFDDDFYERDVVWEKLADWIRLHHPDPKDHFS